MDDTARVHLVPMTDGEFAEFMEREVPGYAEENVRAGRWTSTESMERSREEFRRLLPQGRGTPNHFLFTIRTQPDHTPVGSLWLSLTSPGIAFVYDLVVAPEHRRHGYATAAMRAAERVAVEHGANRIGLNVFGHNPGARALYVRLGYVTMAEQMTKPLASEGRL